MFCLASAWVHRPLNLERRAPVPLLAENIGARDLAIARAKATRHALAGYEICLLLAGVDDCAERAGPGDFSMHAVWTSFAAKKSTSGPS
jgi:hypothetical protein